MLSEYQGNHTKKITHVRKKLGTRNSTGEAQSFEIFRKASMDNVSILIDLPLFNQMKACELSISRHYQNYIAQCCFLTERSVKKNTYTRHADYKTLRRLQIISNNPFVFFHRKLIDVNRCNSRFQLSFSSKCFQWVKVCGMFLPTFVYDSYLRLRDAKGREAMTKYPEIKQL